MKIKKSLINLCLVLPGLGTFLAFLFIGNQTHKLIYSTTNIGIPGVIWGMLTFLIFLSFYQHFFKSLPLFIKKTSDFFLPLLPLFILPSCLGILAHLDLLKGDAIKILIALSIGIILTQIITPFVFMMSTKLFRVGK